MCAQSQSVSFLLAKLGLMNGVKWEEVTLAMFRAHIDDSGTSRNEKVAVASCVLIPGHRLEYFHRQWDEFMKQEGITHLHATSCVAHSQDSEFKDWDDDRSKRVMRRARRLTFDHSIKGFSCFITKADYDACLTPELREAVGQHHYSWAVSSLLGLCYDWSVEHARVPIEYVFDTADKHVRLEIEDALEYSEFLYPGAFAGRYAFRKKTEYLGLQAADSLAWTSYQGMRNKLYGDAIREVAIEGWQDYQSAQERLWFRGNIQPREDLEKWVAVAKDHPKTKQVIEWKRANRRSGT